MMIASGNTSASNDDQKQQQRQRQEQKPKHSSAAVSSSNSTTSDLFDDIQQSFVASSMSRRDTAVSLAKNDPDSDPETLELFNASSQQQQKSSSKKLVQLLRDSTQALIDSVENRRNNYRAGHGGNDSEDDVHRPLLTKPSSSSYSISGISGDHHHFCCDRSGDNCQCSTEVQRNIKETSFDRYGKTMDLPTPNRRTASDVYQRFDGGSVYENSRIPDSKSNANNGFAGPASPRHLHTSYFEPVDNYPSSPFGHRSSDLEDSQKTYNSADTDGDPQDDHRFQIKFPKMKYLKISFLSMLVIYTLTTFIFIKEKKETWVNVAVQEKMPAYLDLSQSLDLMFPVWKLRARGAFLPKEYAHLTNYSIIFTIVQLFNHTQSAYRVVKRPWAASIAANNSFIPLKEIEHTFKLSRNDVFDPDVRYRLRVDTNSKESIGISVTMSGFSELSLDGVILAGLVLVFLYVLIIFEVCNRTLAAMLGATVAIACLTLIRDRPSLEKVVSWLDFETLSLLFGMMIIVAILCDTGFFDYVAVVAFRLARGRTWPLIMTLCLFTGTMSAFLDNVTTILLITPVTIRLCEIKNIEPKHVLISLVIISNIGGAATPVGDPPNVIIISSSAIQQQGVNFGTFTMHMMPGVFLAFISTLIYIRIYYRDIPHTEFHDSTPSASSIHDDIDNNGKRTDTGLDGHITFPIDSAEPEINMKDLSHPFKNYHLSMDIFRQAEHQKPTTETAAGGSATEQTRNMDALCLSSSFCPKPTVVAEPDPLPPPPMPRNAAKPGSVTNLFDLTAVDRCPKRNPLDERRVFHSSDELKREIEVWKRAFNSIVGYSRDENSVRTVLKQKVDNLEATLRQHCYDTVPPENNYRTVLMELEEKYKIKDWPLLIKSISVLVLVISLFFMQSIPNLDLSLGWVAILGAILLLVLSDRHELDSVMGRVEWSTLIFFAALFVVMEALAELKFLWWIGQLTQDFINSVPESSRMIVAILVFIWISALSSSFIDNIPLTTVMVKILEDLAENNEFNIPLVPLIYALAFGACLGGNGTLIGASANVVCSGVAEQHGYGFTFFDFFKVGFPIMLLTVALSTVYLIICHVVFQWNY